MKNSFIIFTSLLALYIACKPSKLIPPDKDLDQKLANGAIILDVRPLKNTKAGTSKVR